MNYIVAKEFYLLLIQDNVNFSHTKTKSDSGDHFEVTAIAMRACNTLKYQL